MKKILFSFVIVALIIFLHAQTPCRVVVYDEAFEGKETAGGDIFSQEKLTAAHESLPFGTEVELFYVQSGKKVTVTVNDRLKNAPDLFWISKAAADSLEIYAVYPTEVLYTVPGSDTLPAPRSLYSELFASLSPTLERPEDNPYLPVERDSDRSGPKEILYGVQIYSTYKHSDAVLLSRRLQGHFDYLSYIEETRTGDRMLYRLIIGNFGTYADASECLQKLQVHIPDSFILKIK